MAVVKNSFIAKVPLSQAIYLLAIAREIVEGLCPNSSAKVLRVRGIIAPPVKNSY